MAANIKRKGKHAPADLPRPPRPAAGDNDDLAGAKNLAARMFDLAMSANPATAQGLVAAYLKSLESIAVIERTMVSRELDAGSLLHADQVRSMLAERDGKIIALLEALPESVAPAANPRDPELARSVVADG
jgi:hypothetical protein